MKQRSRKRRRPPPAAATRRRRPVRFVVAAAALVVAAAALAIAAWFLLPTQSPRVATPEPTPTALDLNVLLITTDTTRADRLGCYGCPNARTPHLDRLASEGTRFACCSACSPLTFPSHCTIMTGTYPFTHGVRQNAIDRLPAERLTLAETLRDAGFTTHAVVASFVLRGIFGLAQGFETYRDVVTAKGANPAAAERKGDAVCDEAIAILRSVAEKKFFVWVHFYDPHFPYESPRVADGSSPEAYADELTFMDAQIGRLVRELDQLPIKRKTLVVVVGDHGEGLGDHGESEHGYLVYQTSMHVPLIAWCPSVIPAGRVIDAQVRTVDLVPTILDYVGQPVADGVQGTSLRPLISGAAQERRLAAYGESMTANSALGMSMLRSLQDGGWKYILSSRPELYRLDDDPHERDNLVSQQPERAARMREQLRALLAEAPPPGREADEAALSPEDAQRLAALGYVASRSDAGAPPSSELAAFEPTGDNPADHAEDIELFVRGHRLLAEKRYDVAEDVLRQAVAAMPRAPEPLRDLHRVLRMLNRDDEILDVCEQGLAADPDATQMRRYYAQHLLRIGRSQEGLAQLEDAVVRDPRNSEAHIELADTLFRVGRLEEARAHYLAGARIDPRSSRALQGLAMVCQRQNKLAEAAEYLRKAIAINPDSAGLKQELRRVLDKIGQ